ncbi:hypothetical protein [Noviherbaspirillum suwonense]|uniref:Conserved repeat domain-containing protein n=1 Tax=Noviherbaspirillum suwonense TaxID=1224511 RepID=A0ABY1Q128_9BURK|nr:hypothetical protein [Noviherbaspirillum suwonense]SMP56021.1 conserved repeat domain-containing protein [Noviherbaspirillum suwonense]
MRSLRALFTCRSLRSLLAVLACLLWWQPAWSCTTGACVTVGPRLASVDIAKSALLNALYGNLLGGNLSLSVADWNALAQGDVGLLGFLNALQARTAVGTPDQALAANATLAQLAAALQASAQADANVALANAYASLASQLAFAGGTIRMADLLQLSVPAASLAGARLNALDLLAGQLQLFNHRNLLTTPAPVGVSASALGLGGVLNGIQLYSQVIEPPVMVCGPSGTQFHSAAIRIKLKLDLVALSPSTGLLTAIPGVLGASVRIANLDVYASVARAEGAIDGIDAIGRLVTVRATPGVADLYLGTFSDSVFFNRSRTLNAAIDLGYGNIGTVNINGAVVALEARSAVIGQAPLGGSASFTGPFPQSRTFGSSSAVLASALSSLVSNLDIRMTPSLGLLNAVVLPVLKTVVAGALSPVLSNVLSGVLDPVLKLLGIGIGEAVVTVNGIAQSCTVSGTVYNDANRNGRFDAGESGTRQALWAKLVAGNAVSAVVSVDPNTGAYSFPSVPMGSYSLLLDVASGAGTAPAGPPGWAGTEAPTLLRTVTISTADLGSQNFGLFGDNTEFTLVKTVDKTTAAPGEVLTYTLNFKNNGAAGVNNLKIEDSVPAYTAFLDAGCGAMPAGVSSCAVSARPDARQAGLVQWTINGMLGAGAGGTVILRVTVN